MASSWWRLLSCPITIHAVATVAIVAPATAVSAVAPPAIAASIFAAPQALPGTASDTTVHPSPQMIRLFLDCQDCDSDYIKTEIPFVEHVRERKDADVHLLQTRQSAAGGGRENTLTFIGQGEYAALSDTLRFLTMPDATDDDIRKSLVKRIELGLVPFVLRTPIGEKLEISYASGDEAPESADPWDSWIFAIEFSSNLNGQKSYGSRYFYSALSAKRITEAWKHQIYLYGSYSDRRFDIGEETITSVSRSQGLESQTVRALGEHWSAGISGAAYSSTYSNIDLSLSLRPAVEANIFPYSESTRRQLRALYEVGPRHFDYETETIYDETAETLFLQSLTVSLEFTQPWGSSETAVYASHYLHDASKYRLEIWGNLSLRLLKGLSLSLSGSGSRIRDQLSLPKGDATREEVLLQRRQQATTYSYYSSIGLKYTFGSIYSSIVNPRFGD